MSLNRKANNSVGSLFRVHVSRCLNCILMAPMEPFWKPSIHGHSTGSLTRGDLVLVTKDILRFSAN